MKKIISILCEGPHDVAFVSKIIKTQGFKQIDHFKLGQYPEPINGLLINESIKTKVEDLNIFEVRQALLPLSTLGLDDIYIFIYSLGGDSRALSRLNYLKKIMDFIPQEKGELNPFPDIQLGVIYFFDADSIGINKRLNKINQEINEIHRTFQFKKNGDIQTINNVKFGCYIFSIQGEENGNLEDVILPLMKMENEEIFEKAEIYLDEHYDHSRCIGKFDRSKSLIGFCGQLQKSGSSNVVCISQTDYITEKKLLEDNTCNEIITFINSFLR